MTAQQAAPLFTGLIAKHPGLQDEIAQQPLTEEQINTGLSAFMDSDEDIGVPMSQADVELVWFKAGVRFAEQAHGIGPSIIGKNK